MTDRDLGSVRTRENSFLGNTEDVIFNSCGAVRIEKNWMGWVCTGKQGGKSVGDRRGNKFQ
jgi:hypothetical protein